MNSSNDHIHTTLGVARDKKVRVRALGIGARLKSTLHSPPQADRSWKPINAFATRFGGEWGLCTVSVFELVPNIGIFAWATETSFH